MQYVITTLAIDRKQDKVWCKIKRWQCNAETGRIYQHTPRYFVNGARSKYSRFYFTKPNELLCECYERKAKAFKDGIAADVFRQLNTPAPQPIVKPVVNITAIVEELKGQNISIPLIKTRYGISDNKARMVWALLHEGDNR